MASANGRFWIVYNGEVYNHGEIRAELEGLGRQFESHCDTEVLLAGYAEWGTAVLDRLIGMRAFAIYDSTQNKLILCRDRFGIKPLYYRAGSDGSLAFGSEIKQFTTMPDWRAAMNGQRVYDFLVHGISDHSDDTMFAGVRQIPPGHLAVIDCAAPLAGMQAGRIPTSRWYQLRPRPFDGSFDEACTAFRERFLDSIRLHMRSDVRIGSCLSGGLDSSSIVCSASGLLGEMEPGARMLTFSACAENPRYDERKWIEVVTRATGAQPHYVYPDARRLFEDARAILWHQDEPYGSTSIYAQWKVFRLAAEHRIKVMLDGQGADEQLAGYHSFFGPHLASLLKRRRLPELFREAVAMRELHGYGLAMLLKYLAASMLPESQIALLRSIGGYGSNTPAWLDLSLLGATPRNPHLVGGSRPSSVEELSAAQLTGSNLQMLLHWEDRNSMASSIESRVPFLDHRLVEFVLGLPTEHKLRHGVTKRVLRGAMKDLVPQPICNRMDKLGFVTPEEIWLRQEQPAQFRAATERAIEASGGLLRGDATRRLLGDVISGERRFTFTPWRIICFGEWISLFGVGK